MEHILLLSEILIINLVLSGDNAVVIAMASKNLPLKQRKRAVWWGAMGAVLLRCVLTWIAIILLKIPFIHAAGGVLLAAIAFKLLLPQEEQSRVTDADSLWRAIRTILAADFIMSLDNVLAVAAIAKGDLSILVIGIGISIPIVVWGSNVLAGWLQRFPVLTYAGAGILAYTAGDMLLQDPRLGPLIASIAPRMEQAVPSLLAVIVISVGWMKKYNMGRD